MPPYVSLTIFLIKKIRNEDLSSQFTFLSLVRLGSVLRNRTTFFILFLFQIQWKYTILSHNSTFCKCILKLWPLIGCQCKTDVYRQCMSIKLSLFGMLSLCINCNLLPTLHVDINDYYLQISLIWKRLEESNSYNTNKGWRSLKKMESYGSVR
jgi:hypothetical protein